MPFDVSGNFTRSYNFQQDRDNGIKILASHVDGEFDNFAAGMNLVFFRDGRVPMSADLQLSATGITGLKNGAVGSPALKFNSETATGPYLDGAGRYAIAVAGVRRSVNHTTGMDVFGAFKVQGDTVLTGNLSVTGTLSATGGTWTTPTLAGTTAAPTPATADNTTKIATTAYVQAQGYITPTYLSTNNYLTLSAAGAIYAPLASPTFTGTPSGPTPATADNSTKLATTAYVQAQGYITTTLAAPKASPALTGTPTAPTAAVGDASSQIATDAFVDRLRGMQPRTIAGGNLVIGDRGNVVISTAAVTTPNAVFAAGDVVLVYNDSAAGFLITQGASVTQRLSGTATIGNLTLAQRGQCTIFWKSASECIVSGNVS